MRRYAGGTGRAAQGTRSQIASTLSSGYLGEMEEMAATTHSMGLRGLVLQRLNG